MKAAWPVFLSALKYKLLEHKCMKCHSKLERFVSAIIMFRCTSSCLAVQVIWQDGLVRGGGTSRTVQWLACREFDETYSSPRSKLILFSPPHPYHPCSRSTLPSKEYYGCNVTKCPELAIRFSYSPGVNINKQRRC